MITLPVLMISYLSVIIQEEKDGMEDESNRNGMRFNGTKHKVIQKKDFCYKFGAYQLETTE